MAQQTIPTSSNMGTLVDSINNNFNELFVRAQNNGIPLDESLFFTDNTARDAAIPTPSEGQFCAVLIKNNEYYLEQYQVDTWVKVSIGNRIENILYISGISVNDESFGQSLLEAPHIVDTTTAGLPVKIGGAWTDGGMNTDFTTSPNNSIVSNIKGRFIFTGASVLSTDKPCSINIMLYKNGVEYLTTSYSFNNAGAQQTPGTNIAFEIEKNDTFEIWVSSSVVNTAVNIDTLTTTFKLVKKHY